MCVLQHEDCCAYAGHVSKQKRPCVINEHGAVPLKAEPGRPRESSDRRDKDQARSASRKRDRENERNGGRYAWVVIPTAVVTRLCAISRCEGKAKGGTEARRRRDYARVGSDRS